MCLIVGEVAAALSLGVRFADFQYGHHRRSEETTRKRKPETEGRDDQAYLDLVKVLTHGIRLVLEIKTGWRFAPKKSRLLGTLTLNENMVWNCLDSCQDYPDSVSIQKLALPKIWY